MRADTAIAVFAILLPTASVDAFEAKALYRFCKGQVSEAAKEAAEQTRPRIYARPR